MRIWILTVLLSLPAGCDRSTPARGGRRGPPDELDFKAELLRRDHDLQWVETSPIPHAAGFFVATCDREKHWWGTFECARWRDDHFAYAAPDAMPDEQSILSVRGFAVAGMRGPLVEVFGTTHMGNGNYYLYEWDGDTLRQLLTTFAVDNHDDGQVIRGGRLSVQYVGSPAYRPDGILFTGIIDKTSDGDPDPNFVPRSLPYRKAFRWDEMSRHYVEDTSQRVGFELYPDRS